MKTTIYRDHPPAMQRSKGKEAGSGSRRGGREGGGNACRLPRFARCGQRGWERGGALVHQENIGVEGDDLNWMESSPGRRKH